MIIKKGSAAVYSRSVINKFDSHGGTRKFKFSTYIKEQDEICEKLRNAVGEFYAIVYIIINRN